ncbi:MAG: ABC transporter permease [Thermoleophilaceae bacterium]|nr:ABC transporter permease [Thermoleophilaceae bacterium]
MTSTSADPALAPAVDVAEAPPRSIVRDAVAELRAVARYRHLLRYLVSSSLKTEHANTVLGFLWWVLDPLLLASVYVLLVGVLLQRGGPDFPIFVVAGIIAWELFSKGSLNMVSGTVRKEASMRQVVFPKSVLPLSEIGAAAIHWAFAFSVLLVIAIPFGIYPSAYALLALPIVLVQLVLTLGVGFFLSAFNIFFRDTTRLMQYVFRIGFYLSPVLYPVSVVPERFRDLYLLNPFATLIPAYRDVVMEHRLPDFGALAIVAGGSIVVLILGYLFFVRCQPWFAKLV